MWLDINPYNVFAKQYLRSFLLHCRANVGPEELVRKTRA